MEEYNKTYRFKPNEYPLENGFRIIEASAGTGKTFSLAHIVLRLLTEKKLKPSQILVVSFTNATAAEIKSRIITRIAKALQGIEYESNFIKQGFTDNTLKSWIKLHATNDKRRLSLKSLLLEALENIDRADITTIHGFCNRTLKREALECGSIFSPLISDDDAELIREISNDYWKSQILELNPDHLRGLQKAGFTLEALIESISKIDNDSSLQFKIQINGLNESKSLNEQFENILSLYWYQFISEWKKNGSYLDKELINIARDLKSNGIKNTKPFSANPRKDRANLITEWVNNYTNVNDQNHYYGPGYGEVRDQKKLISDYFHPQNLYDLLAVKNKTDLSINNIELQHLIAQLWDGPAEIAWNHSLSRILNLLEKRRFKNGIISNGGLLKALDPIGKHIQVSEVSSNPKSELFQKLRQRYKAILVDEFQDTDPVQWRIIKEAFGNSKDHLLLAVGDPKQAIYQFRGGDLNTYLDARKEAERVDALLENYRATNTLMEGINKLISKGLPHSKLKAPYLKPCATEKPLPLKRGKYPIELLYVRDEDSILDNGEEKLFTKSTLERVIPNIISNHVIEILSSYSEQLKLSDLCILVRTHKQAANIKESLERSNLPCRLINKEDVFKTDAAQVLESFLNCLAYPGDTGYLKLIACSPLVQWSSDEIKEAERNGALDVLAFKFRYWEQNLNKLGVMGCVSELLESHTIADLSKRGRLYADLNQCSQLVQEEIHRQGLNAVNAAKWLRKNRFQSPNKIPLNRQQNSDIEENAINVITIHQSKGLQYKVVLCPYLWQSPSNQKGPLWREEEKKEWYIAVNSRWNQKMSINKQAKAKELEESERLAYVALTRACKYLVLVWGRAQNQEANPLISFLFGPEAINYKMRDLTGQRMKQWISLNNLELTTKYVSHSIGNSSYSLTTTTQDLISGPIPKRSLEKAWGRHSYSSWVNKHNDTNINRRLVNSEEGKDRDEQKVELIIENTSKNKLINTNARDSVIFYKDNPLKDFPRGSLAGECLHRIFEKFNFQESINSLKNGRLVKEELDRSGIDKEYLEHVQKGLERVLNIPMGGPLKQKRLREIKAQQRIHEFSFDIPLSYAGKEINPRNLSQVFRKDPDARFGESYANQISNLDFSSKGFLTGSIDMIFADQENHINARWWVVDWKSNWIGKQSGDEVLACGPSNYDNETMEKQMLHHHYPLQAHLYLLAMHRLLKWRLPHYSPTKHLGGYIYFFLRGVPEEEELKIESTNSSIPGLFIEKAPINRVMALDDLFEKGKI